MLSAILARFSSPTVTVLVLFFLASTGVHAEQTKATESTDPKDSYAVQLNAFADKKNAEQFVLKMKAKGYQPYIVTFEKVKILYKVLIGPYSSQAKALQTAKALSQKEGLKAIVVSANKTSQEQGNSGKASEISPSAGTKTSAPTTNPQQNKKEKKEKSALVTKKRSQSPQATGKAQYASTDVVASLFLQWVRAWQGRDAETYLQFYSQDFAHTGTSLKAWKDSRRVALADNKEINIDISDIQIKQTGDIVEMTFVQQYKSEKYSDKGRKTLTWKKEGDSWKITREVWSAI